MSHGFLMAVAERLGIAESIALPCWLCEPKLISYKEADMSVRNLVLYIASYTGCYACKACQYGPFTAHICPAEVTRNKKK